MDSVIVFRNPNSDSELAIKKYVDDSKGGGNFLRFNQTLQNYLQVTVGNYTYNLTKHDKIQITHVTKNRYPNTGILFKKGHSIVNIFSSVFLALLLTIVERRKYNCHDVANHMNCINS